MQTQQQAPKFYAGELRQKGVGISHSFAIPSPDSTREQFVAWANRSDLMPHKDGSQTRIARVWLNTFDQSRHFERVFVTVRVPSTIPESEQHCLAMHKAHKRGKKYSQIMWQRSGGTGSFEALAFADLAVQK